MGRRLRLVVLALAVLTVAWVVPVVAVNAIENRHSVDIRQLIVNDPRAYPALARHDWQDLSIDPNTAGAYGRTWSSGKIRLAQTVHKYNSTAGALVAYSEHDPLLTHRPKEVAVSTAFIPELTADQAQISCDQYTKKKGKLRCDMWRAWMRYGQYTVDIFVKNVIMTAPEFISITKQANTVMSRAVQ
jgi:hypothetical protein